MCVSRTSAILFTPGTGAVADHCQSAKDADAYFKSQLNVKDPGLSAVDGIRTDNLLIDNLRLTTRTPTLLANLKGLNVRHSTSLDSQTLCRLFPVINNPKSHMFIQHFELAKLQVSNCCAERACITHEVTFSAASDDHIEGSMITVLHKYISMKIHTLY